MCIYFGFSKKKYHELKCFKIVTSAAPETNESKKESRSSKEDDGPRLLNTSLTSVSFDKLFGSKRNSAFCLEERESSTDS